MSSPRPAPGASAILRRRRRTHRAGYTLGEIAIAAAITGMMIVVTIAWVTSLLNLSTTQAAVSVPRTSGQFVSDQLRSDLSGAVACSSSGLASPLLHIDDHELHLYTTVAEPDGDGGTQTSVVRVSWLYDPATSQLSRSQYPDPYAPSGTVGDPDQWVMHDGQLPDPVTCDTSGLPQVGSLGGVNWTPIASFVSDQPGVPLFHGMGGPSPGFVGDCTTAANACLFSHVRLRAEIASPAGTRSTLDRAFDLNTASSRL